MGTYADRKNNKFNSYDYHIFENWYKDKYYNYPYYYTDSWCGGGEFFLYSDINKKELIATGSEMIGTHFKIVNENIKNDFIDYLYSNHIPYIDNKEDIIKETIDKIGYKYTVKNLLKELLDNAELVDKYKDLENKYEERNVKYCDLAARFHIATEMIKKNNLVEDFYKECDQYYEEKRKTK